jgi:hypothetical protein
VLPIRMSVMITDSNGMREVVLKERNIRSDVTDPPAANGCGSWGVLYYRQLYQAKKIRWSGTLASAQLVVQCVGGTSTNDFYVDDCFMRKLPFSVADAPAALFRSGFETNEPLPGSANKPVALSNVEGAACQVGQWKQIEIPIGQWLANKVVRQVALAFDQPGAKGPFKAVVDDVSIGQE